MRIGIGAAGYGWTAPLPTRDARTGDLHFKDAPAFRPNLTPEEVLRRGSFGGGYFRAIDSAVTKQRHAGAHRELPPSWLRGLDVKARVASGVYDTTVNRYGVNCGVKEGKADAFGLAAWQNSGWIAAQDPFGWFQWYCRFFEGRRSADDARQLGRWERCAGARGRWRGNLIGKCLRDGKGFDDASVSPVVRQTLQHWGYALTAAHFDEGARRVKANGAAYLPRNQLAHVLAPPDADDGAVAARDAAAAAAREERASKRARR